MGLPLLFSNLLPLFDQSHALEYRGSDDDDGYSL